MSLSPESLSSLLELLYDAATDPGRWPDFLNALSAQAGATRSYFLLQDSDKHRDFSIQIGFDEQEQKDYVSYYAQHDMLFQRVVEAQQRAGGDWICERSALVPDDELYKSLIYNEFLRPAGPKHIAVAALSGLPGITGGLGIQRPGSQAPFGEETLSLITILAPHVKRALGLHKTLNRLRDENEDLRSTVEEIGCPVMTTDAHGQILQSTSSAQASLERKNGLFVTNYRLSAAVSSEQQRLEALICGAAATASGRGFEVPVEQSLSHSPQAGKSARWSAPFGGAMLVSRRPPKRPLQIAVFPFRSSTLLLETRPAALIFLTDPDAIPAPRGEVLRALYGLSPSEARLADCLAAGMELKSAAEHLRLTQETARFQLKQIFRKCGVHSQSALIRLSLALPGSR